MTDSFPQGFEALPEPLPQGFQPLDPEGQIEQETGLRPGLLSTFKKLEGSPVGSVNPKSGASGPYQIMPNLVSEYSKQFGRSLDPNDPHDGAFMAAQVALDAKRKYPDNEEAQIAYYNGGSRAGDQVVKGLMTNPETDAYLNRYRNLVKVR